MNSNIFIKKKNNKFNPDVIQKYSEINNNRHNTKFDFLNKPYKMIINDNIPNNITSQEDLKISIKNNKKDIHENFENLVNNRKYLDNENDKKFNKKNYNENKATFDFRTYQVSTISHNSNDYNTLNKNKKSYYDKQKTIISDEKSRYNDIMNNLNIFCCIL